MAFLSQASHLGSLLLPHDAFQEHAAHRAEWSAQLSSKGSERTCIRSGLATFLHCAFTAHPDLVVKGISSTQDVDTGHYGVSRSHHRRLIDLHAIRDKVPDRTDLHTYIFPCYGSPGEQ